MKKLIMSILLILAFGPALYSQSPVMDILTGTHLTGIMPKDFNAKKYVFISLRDSSNTAVDTLNLAYQPYGDTLWYDIGAINLSTNKVESPLIPGDGKGITYLANIPSPGQLKITKTNVGTAKTKRTKITWEGR